MENNSVIVFLRQPEFRGTSLLVGVGGMLLSAAGYLLSGFSLLLIPLVIFGALWVLALGREAWFLFRS